MKSFLNPKKQGKSMRFIPCLPGDQVEVSYTLDGDPVIVPRGGNIHISPDGDMTGLPKGCTAPYFTIDGDLQAKTQGGEIMEYRASLNDGPTLDQVEDEIDRMHDPFLQRLPLLARI